jgi:predicted transposase/invertase (TIGR01784 family)
MAVTENQSQNAESPKHDKGYKSLLSNNGVFLHFLKKYFAESWIDNISPDDMERVDKSFITEEYKNIDSDLIYKLKINGSDVYFYVLIELQSEVDFTMPFRLLNYMVELLNVIFKNTKKEVRERKDFRLPAIVPIVLYNGKDNWTSAMTLREYTENCEFFGNNIIDFRYLLLDLNRTDEGAIEPVENPLDAVFLFF